MSKTVNASTTNQTWDTAEGLPLIVQDGSTSSVTGAGGLPLEQISGSTVYYFHSDQLGSTRALTDSAGTVQQTYDYDPYGNALAGAGSITNPFQYAGQYVDLESSLYYLRARYIDTLSGQFLARDPMVTATRAPYSYTADSPLNGTDPTGLAACVGTICLPWDPRSVLERLLPWLNRGAGLLRGAGTIGIIIIEILLIIQEGGGPLFPKDAGQRNEMSGPSCEYPGSDPTRAPGPDWDWKGSGPPESGKGNWVNRKTGEQLHPDLDNSTHGPLWDWTDPNGNQSRWYPDGHMEPK
jgi:RHS repeat-associated protein